MTRGPELPILGAMHRIELPGGQSCPYRVQESGRARSIRLKLSAAEGLVVIIPARVIIPREQLEELIREKSQWIARHVHRFKQLGRPTPGADTISLPRTIDLPSVHEHWKVRYAAERPTGLDFRPTAPRVTILDHGLLQVTGSADHPRDCALALRAWVRAKADAVLPDWLDALARELGMPFSRVTIRDQQTRWGSCTSQGRISLNCKLLLLPRPWTRYVLLHELCHTQLMNHGPHFWDLLTRYEPRARQIRTEMRQAWEKLPVWLRVRPKSVKKRPDPRTTDAGSGG